MATFALDPRMNMIVKLCPLKDMNCWISEWMISGTGDDRRLRNLHRRRWSRRPWPWVDRQRINHVCHHSYAPDNQKISDLAGSVCHICLHYHKLCSVLDSDSDHVTSMARGSRICCCQSSHFRLFRQWRPLGSSDWPTEVRRKKQWQWKKIKKENETERTTKGKEKNKKSK